MYKFIFISLFLVGCASNEVTNDAVVKVHNDYILLNGVSVECVDVLSKKVEHFQNIYLEDHVCTKHEKFMEVINKISNNSNAQLHVKIYGFDEIESCN